MATKKFIHEEIDTFNFDEEFKPPAADQFGFRVGDGSILNNETIGGNTQVIGGSNNTTIGTGDANDTLSDLLGTMSDQNYVPKS